MDKFTDFIVDNSHTNWINYVEQFSEFLKSGFLTYGDFSNILKRIINHPNSKLAGLKLEIESVDDKETVFIFSEYPEENDHDNLEKEYLDSHNWFLCKYSLWFGKHVQKEGTAKDEVKKLIKELVTSFWKKSLRDEKTRIWAKAVPETNQLINSTLSYYKEKSHYISFLYCDLDKFKVLNDEHGTHSADGVLLQMANLFTKFIINEKAILIHDKGDEFIILIFSLYIEEAISVAYRFQETLKNRKFSIETKDGIKSVDHEITVGMNIRYTQTNDDISFSSEIQLAEQAIHYDGKKLYRTANLFNATKQNLNIQALNSFTANISKLNLKACASKIIFRNVWLNFIAERVRELITAGNDLKAIKTVIDWVSPIYEDCCSSSYEYSNQPDYTKRISPFDVLMSIARGVYQANDSRYSGKNLTIDGTKKEIRLVVGSEKLFAIEKPCTVKLKMGSFFKTTNAPVALLVKIGHSKLMVPEKIFGAIVTVDDRPSQGGGLPDFWELALAKVVSHINDDPNLRYVYIIGERKYAINTLEWLEKFGDGKVSGKEIETLIYKIHTNVSALNETASRLRNAVKLYSSYEDIVNAYAGLVTDGQAIEILQKDSAKDKQPPFLQKEVRMTEFALSMEDGFKVKTLSEAYPLMLEIARRSSTRNEGIRDQARGLLGELIDFKVELSNPTKDLIPFYYNNDEKKFQDYFIKLFLDKDGLFSTYLEPQIDPVLKHIEESITTERKQYSTRRAILIIPNRIEKDELFPLGLVSIRIIPRFQNPKTVALVFSFTWRTVEALVGFPFSLYGSVRYSQHLTEMLQNRVTSKGLKITFDKVSYNANSLHIFMDEQGQDIAKSIINDASI